MLSNSTDLTVVVPGGMVRGSKDPVTAYLSSLGSKLSQRNMGYSLDLIARLMGGSPEPDRYSVNWAALRSHHVQAVRSRLQEKGYAPASANRHLAALKGVLRECWRLELMSSDDYHRAVDVKPVRGYREPPGRALEHRELKALFQAAADGTRAGARNAAILAVLYGAGLRSSEVAALSIGDWNPHTLTLKVRGKGNKERLVYLNNGSLDAMAAWMKLRAGAAPEAPLFVSILKNDRLLEKGFTPEAINIALHKLKEKAGLDPFTPHDMRRSYIGDAQANGADLGIIQKLVGHASPLTTAKYDRRGETAKRDASALIKVPYVPNR